MEEIVLSSDKARNLISRTELGMGSIDSRALLEVGHMEFWSDEDHDFDA